MSTIIRIVWKTIVWLIRIGLVIGFIAGLFFAKWAFDLKVPPTSKQENLLEHSTREKKP